MFKQWRFFGALILLFCFSLSSAFAKTVYWVGGEGSWSDAANHWAATTNGSPGAENIPIEGDSVVFDASSGSGAVTVDTSISILNLGTTNSGIGITINSDVSFTSTGTLTLSSGRTLTNNGVATIASLGSGSGTWIQGIGSTLNYGGTSITPTLTASANGNTVNYTANAAINGKGTTYYNLGIGVGASLSANRQYSFSSNTLVTNVLTVGPTSGDYTVMLKGSGIIYLSGTGTPLVMNAKGLLGTDSSNPSYIYYVSDGPSTVTSTSYYILSVGNTDNLTADRTYTLGGDVTTSSFTVGASSGIYKAYLDAASYTITINNSGTSCTVGWGLYFNSYGDFIASTSTVNYIGDCTTLNYIISKTFYNLNIGGSGITGNRTYAPANALRVTNNFTIGAASGYTANFDTDASGTVYNLTAGNITINPAGTLTANSSTITITGTGSPFVNNGTFTQGSSVVNYTGNGITTVTPLTYWQLQIGNTTGLSAGRTYTLGGNVIVSSTLSIGPSSGTYTHILDTNSSSSYSLTASSINIQSKGILTANASTITLTGASLTTGGTFNANTSTVNYQSNSNTTVTGATYYNLQLGVGATLTSNRTYTLSANATVTNLLTIGQTASAYIITFSPSSYTLNISGQGTPVVINSFNGVDTGVFSNSAGTVNYIGNEATVVAGTTYYNLQIGNTTTQTASRTYTLGGNTTVKNVLTIGSATNNNGYIHTLDASNYTITLDTAATPFVINTYGSFTASTSTVNYAANAAQTIKAATYFNLQAGVGTSLTAARNYTLGGNVIVANVMSIGPTGGNYTATLNPSTYTVILSGTSVPLNVNSKGAVSGSAGTVNYIGDGPTTIAGADYYHLQIGNTTIQTADRTYTLGGNVSVGGTLTVGPSSGSYTHTLDGANYTLTLKGANPMLINTNGAFTSSSSTVNFAGNSNQSVNALNYYNLQIGVGATITAARTYTLTGNVAVANVLTVGVGLGSTLATFSGGASNYTTTLSGNGTPLVINSQGAISTTQGTIKYTGTAANITMTPYYNLNLTDAVNDSADTTMTFDNTGTVTVAGLFTVDGTDDNDRVNLVSNSPGNQWSLIASGTFAIDYADVRDSDASGGLQPTYTNTVSSGNNLNWGLNTAPSLTSISDSPDPIRGGSTVTITPIGQGDTDSDVLNFYCNESGSPTGGTSLCTEGIGYSSPYSSMSCNFTVGVSNTTRTVYCRTYDGSEYSPERTTTYTVDSNPSDAPVASPAGGTYTSIQSVTLSSVGSSAIHYTTNSNTPTTGSTIYSSPITIGSSLTLKALAVDAVGNTSSVMTETYVINLDPDAPVISSIGATVGIDSVIITWTTNEDSSSQVEYGLTAVYGTTTPETDTATRVTGHSTTINSLKSCAHYYYRVKSKDGNSNQGTSFQSTFATTGCQTSSISIGTGATVSTPGGSVSLTTDNGTAAISAPTNYYSETTTIQINKLNTSSAPSAPSGTSLLNDNFFNLLAVSESGIGVTAFNQPVSFVVIYGSAAESSYDENTLDIYKYADGSWIDQNCTLDTAVNTLTCTLSGFSVYAVFGRSVTSSNTSSSGSNPGSSFSSPPACVDPKPVNAPDLFQIDTTFTQATLYFTPIARNTKYYISYSTRDTAEEHGAEVDLGSEGVQSFTVNLLSPDTIYYFKVRGQNGCTPGDWSNIKKTNIDPYQNVEMILEETVADTESKTLSPNPAPRLRKPITVKPTPLPTAYPVIKDIKDFGALMVNSLGEKFKAVKKEVSGGFFVIGGKTQNISRSIGYAIINLGYSFIDEPTRIYDVKVEILSPTSTRIFWKTNHPANGKVNYGHDRTYPLDIQSEKRVTDHQFILTKLEPDSLYYFEIMSQAKTYIYDANREFRTPKK